MDGSVEKNLNDRKNSRSYEGLHGYKGLHEEKGLHGEKGSRGGRREGAGRPKTYSKLYTFRAPKELVPIIDAQPSKSDFFKECISRAVAGSAVSDIVGGDTAGVVAGLALQKEQAGQLEQMEQAGQLGQMEQAGQLEQKEQAGQLEQKEQAGQLEQTDQAGQAGQLEQKEQAGQLEQTEQAGQLGQKAQMGQFGRVVPAERVRPLSLPFFDIGIVAGFPIPLDNDERAQDIELLRMLCPNPESSYLIRVEGDSMIDAGIFSGDIVIVDKSNRNPSESQVAVCEFNGEYTLKRFVQRDGAGWLVPANPDYPEIRVTPDDSFSIWGTVTYIIHKPRG